MTILAICAGLVAVVLGGWLFLRSPSDSSTNQNESHGDTGVLQSDLPSDLQDAINEQINKLPSSELRILAMNSYDEAFNSSMSSTGNRDKSHEVALVNVLWKRISLTDPTLKLDERIAGFLQGEAFPFSRVGPDTGKASMVEYLIWREKRNEGDIAMIRSTLAAAKNSMSDDNDARGLWQAISSGPFEWTRLL